MDIIKLASFDFDSDRLEKGIEELQKQLFDLTKRQQELNAQSKEVNKSLADQTKEQERLVQNFKNGSHEYQKAVQEQYKLRKAGQENTKAYKELNAEKKLLVANFKEENRDYQQASQSITQLTNKQEGLFLSTKDLQIQRTAVNKEYQTATTLYKQFIGVNGEVLSLQDVIEKSVKRDVETRKEAKEVNIQLNRIKDQLNITNDAEKQLLEDINKRIDANNKLLKETGSENEKRIAGIGQYSKGIEEAAGNIDIFNGGLGNFIQKSQEAGGAGNLFSNSIKAITQGIIGMTRAALAFLATPIGAVVGAIGAAFALVANYLRSSKEGMDMLTSVTRPLSAVFQTMIGMLQQLGKLLVDVFVNPKKHITDLYNFVKDRVIKQFEALGKIVQGIFTLDFSKIKEGMDDTASQMIQDWNSVKNAASGFVGEISKAVKIGQEIDEITKQIEDKEIELIESRAKNNRELAEQRAIMNDTNSTLEEKLKANEEEFRLIQKIEQEEQGLLQLRIKQLELKQSMTEATRDDLRELAELRAQEDAFAQKRAESQNRHFRNKRRLQSEAHKEAIKQMDVEIAKQREQLDLWIAQQGDKARTLQEQLQLQEDVSKKEIAILDKQLKNKKISQEKYDLEVLKLTQDTAKLQAQIAVQLAEDNLETYIYENKSRLENGQLLTDELLQQEIDRNKALQAERDAFEKLRFDSGLIDQREYDQALIANQRTYLEEEKALKKQYAEDQRDIDALRRAEESQKIILELEGRLASEAEIKKAQAQFEFEDQKLQLEMQRADGLITEENYQLALNNIIAANAQIRKQIEEDTQRSKLELFESVFAGMSQAVSEHTALAKAAGIATATINTWQGVSEVWKSPAVLPEPFNTILKGVQTGVTIGAGFNAVRNITKTKTPENKSKKTSSSKKMAKGGLTEIGGKLHSQGGTKFYGEDGTSFEAEKGELIGVMNRAAAANFMNYNNSFLNNGAKTYPNFFANGGFVGVKASNLLPVQQGLFGKFDVSTIADAVKQGALEGTQEGSFQGSQQGTAVGSQQGISQLSQDRSAQSNSYI